MSETLPVSVQLRIEEVCTRFEHAWKAAGVDESLPRIEDYLGEPTEPERSALLQELLRLDLYYRQHRGERPTAEGYTARYPHDGEAIRAIFAALALVPAAGGVEAGVP